MKRRITIRHVLAALAWLGLALAPIATPTGAMAAQMEMAAPGVEGATMDMPEGMPCCPETDKKPDCAKDCPFMALCAMQLLAGPANSPSIAAPVSFTTLILPANSAKLSGLAQAPPPRPPKA